MKPSTKKFQDLTTEEIQQRIDERYPVATRKKPYGRVSYAYKVNQDNPYELLPDEEYIAVLEEAFDMVEGGIAYREITPWVQEQTTSPITFQSINNLYNKHRKPFVRVKTERNKMPKHLKLSKTERELRAAKRRATEAGKKVQELQAKKEAKKLEKLNEGKDPKTSYIHKELPESHKPKEEHKPFFEPNPGPQWDFLASPEQEVLYGGAAGGGKSFALLVDPIRYFDNPNFRGLLVRRTNDELRELKDKSFQLYKAWNPDARWKEKDSQWVFPSGASLWMTYLEQDKDVTRYQGQSYTWIAFDELTQWPTPYAWDYLRSRLRSTDPNIPLAMRATTNPGGIGHHWVKKMFIDPAPAKQAFWARHMETGEVLRYPKAYPPNHSKAGEPHPMADKPLFKRKFIPASLYDNPFLLQDGSYEANLMSLTENEKRKLLYGDWDVMEGAAFPEFNRATHVVEPFEIPHDWRKFRACDYGYSSHSAVLWFAIDPGDRLWVYRELYVSKMGPVDLARTIKELERNDGTIYYGVLDSSVWHKRGEGPSAAEVMIAEGCKWRPSDRSAGSRVSGRLRLHELLKKEEMTNEPKIFFFNTCTQLISDIPTLPTDPDGGDDIDIKFKSDHTYDALRYGIMSRPRSMSPFETWGQGVVEPTHYGDPAFGY